MRTYTTVAVIRRPLSDVFDYLSDLRSELDWNPDARRIEKLSDEPVGAGTRFRATWRNVPTTVVEITSFEPPRRWQTSSSSLGMEVVFTGELSEADGGTRYVARLDLRASGLSRLIAPFAVHVMRRQDQTNMSLIKRALEQGARGPTARSSAAARPAGGRIRRSS